MISDWLYKLTLKIGWCFNNAAGLKNNEIESLLTGITIIWFLLINFLILIIYLIILYNDKQKKEQNNEKTN